MGSRKEDVNVELKQFIGKYIKEKKDCVGVGVFGDDKILDASIDKACDDMTARTLKVRTGENKGGKKKGGKNFKCDVKEYLGERMKDHFASENYEEDKFDGWHNITCDEVLPIIKRHYEARNGKSNEAKYGKAQKIVNMTFKYLYCFAKEEEREKYFKYCHIPLDSYMIKALFLMPGDKNSIKKQINKKYKENKNTVLIKGPDFSYANKEGKLKFNGKELILNEDWRSYRGINSPVTWSNIEDDEYKAVQDAVKSQIPDDYKYSPLLWENRVWTFARKL